jgi:hypothetical protein
VVAIIRPFRRRCDDEGCWYEGTHIVYDNDNSPQGVHCWTHAREIAEFLDGREVHQMMQNTSVAALFKEPQLALTSGL